MVVVDATVGSAELRVDGVTILTFSGNTKGTATAGIQAVDFLANTSNSFALDDVMIWNSQGLAPTDFVGDFRIDAYTPTANGSTVNASFVGAGVTVAYQAVDDPALNNADTDYILDDVINDINLFAMADLATTPTSDDRRRHRGGGAGRQCRHPQDSARQQIGGRDRVVRHRHHAPGAGGVRGQEPVLPARSGHGCGLDRRGRQRHRGRLQSDGLMVSVVA
jgi:hypothetical protein